MKKIMDFSFLSEDFENAVGKVLELYAGVKDDATLDDWSKLLIENLAFVSSLPQADRREFEEYCLLTKKYYGFNLLHIFDKGQNTTVTEKLERFTLCMYVYYKEMHFRQGVDDPKMLKPFFNFIENNKLKFLPNLNYFFKFVDQIPYLVMSEIYSNPNFQKISQTIQEPRFEKYLESFNKIDSVIAKIETWENTLETKQNAVTQLESRLESSKQKYDFVLLNAGFKSLYDQKKEDLKDPTSNYKWIFRFILIIPILEILFFSCLIAREIDINSATIWYMLIPSISLILFLFYFYRINLQEVRSIRSQMMQLELRMALCQFIHNYAEDSEKLHKKNTAGFEKFENIIFSPLVSSDDKIPTTFDGMEQLAKLVSEFRK